MDITRTIEALSRPGAYPHPTEVIEVRQTHISAVFLVGPFAYKVKKPVRLPFLDFSTPEARRHFCEEEVRLNRRLAGNIYLGVVPVTLDLPGEGLKFGGEGEAVDWAVRMRRLPDDRNLKALVDRGEARPAHIEALAARLAAFHASAERVVPRSLEYGTFAAVSKLVRDALKLGAPLAGKAVPEAVYARLRGLAESALGGHRALIDARAERGMTREGHGDLRLDHVYFLPELAVIDCIEFSEGLRFCDPVADIAFLVMDLSAHGRRDLARHFADEYFRASGDEEGRQLLPLYTAYRAIVRGAVAGLLLKEEEVPESERQAAFARSCGCWLLALGELAEV